MAFSALYIDLAIKHNQLAEDYTNIGEEVSTLKGELARIEQLYKLARGPNKEYPSNIVLAFGYWFSYHQDLNLTSGKPFICVYVPDDDLTFEIYVEAISVESIKPHLTIQKGTPYMSEPIPDLFIGPYLQRFQSFTFDAPSAGWYTVSLVGHITPSLSGGSPGSGWSIGGNLYNVNARVRVLRVKEAVLFGVGAGSY